jgi:hypothetical protein
MRGFNPRAHVGRDMGVPITKPYLQKFHSTRPRGARRPCCGNFKRIREDMLCKTCFWQLSKEFKNAIKYKPKGWVDKFFAALAMLKKDREK